MGHRLAHTLTALLRRAVSNAPAKSSVAPSLLALLLATAACRLLLESPDATFRSNDATDAGTDAGSTAFAAYLKSPSPQVFAWFGESIAATASIVAVTSPLEDVETEAGLVPRGGATYLFGTAPDAGPARRLVAPNVAADDGDLPGSVLSGRASQMQDWGALRVSLTDQALIVGACAKDGSKGAVYAYDRAALAATPGYAPQYITSADAHAGDLFGEAVSLSGSWLAIGAPGDSSGVSVDPTDQSSHGSGAVHMYHRQGASFVSSGYLKAPDIEAGAAFGTAVSIAGDLLAVGAPLQNARAGADAADGSVSNAGGVYVYRLGDAGWALEKSLTPSVPWTAGYFGLSVSVSGSSLAIGAPAAGGCVLDHPATERGAVYVASDRGGQWSIDECLMPLSGDGGVLFGWDLGLLGDRLVVGAPWDGSDRPDNPTDTSVPFGGAAYLYRRGTDADWRETDYVKAPTRHIGDVFGFATALAPGLLAIGAYQESGNGSNVNWTSPDAAVLQSGAAYLFAVED